MNDTTILIYSSIKSCRLIGLEEWYLLLIVVFQNHYGHRCFQPRNMAERLASFSVVQFSASYSHKIFIDLFSARKILLKKSEMSFVVSLQNITTKHAINYSYYTELSILIIKHFVIETVNKRIL